MNLREVVIKFDITEIKEILSIELDDDNRRAFLYLKENLAKKIKRSLESH